MSLCTLPHLSDWDSPEFQSLLEELHIFHGHEQIHRKHWEFIQLIRGLRQIGCITPDAVALSVGAGHEHPLYYFANHIREMHATDVYGQGDFIGYENNAEVLINPEKFAPFPYRKDHLIVRYMNALDLKYPDNTFDFVFSLSSIEHFGGHEAASSAMREMARVLKPGGVAAIATECILNGAPHHEFFLPRDIERYLVKASNLELIEEIDYTTSPSLLDAPLDVSTNIDNIFPHIVIKAGPITFTSIMLFLRKK